MSQRAPEGMPVLGRGQHRRPAQGACFMELASVMAGERWSDHPTCTHPVLAEVARLVNDSSTDAHRSALAVLVPSVVGLTGPDVDLRWTVGLTAAVATHAVTRAPRSSRYALAAGMLTVQRAVEVRGLGEVPGTEGIPTALAAAPRETALARRLTPRRPVGDRMLRRQVAPAVARSAVKGLVTRNQVAPDPALRELLEVAIETAQRLAATEPSTERATLQPDAAPRVLS